MNAFTTHTHLIGRKIAVGIALSCVLSMSSASLISATVAHAATGTAGQYQVLAPLPCIEGGTFKCTQSADLSIDSNGLVTGTSFKGYIQYLFNLIIALAAVAAVFMIVWGGFTYMSTDSFNKKEEGLEKVRHAVYGLLLVLCSYIILRTVDPRLTEISDTLVPPLQLKDNSSLLTDITGAAMTTPPDAQNAQTAQQAAADSVAQQAAATAAANRSNAAIVALNGIQDQMNQQGCTSASTDASCVSLRAQAASKQNEVNTYAAISITSTAQATFNNLVNTELYNGGNVSVTQVANITTNLYNTYTQAKNTLQAINAADQITQLDAAYNAALKNISQITIRQ